MSQEVISKARPSATEFKNEAASEKRSGFTALFSNSDVPIVVLFCVAGLLVAAYLTARFPQVGEAILQSNLF